MPLKEGSSKEAVGYNIKAEEASGKGRAQAIAIALAKKRKAMGK